MRAQPVEGKLIGTFNGRIGDQFQLMEAKVDVLLQDTYVDEETGERVFVVAYRGHKPVDEFRMVLEYPEHGYEKLVEEIEDERRSD